MRTTGKFIAIAIFSAILSSLMACASLKEAFDKKDYDRVLNMLKNGANPNITDEQGIPYIFHAVKRESSGVVELMIKNGVDVNITLSNKNENGITLLMKAAQNTSITASDIVKILLQSGAEVNRKSSIGTTALMHSASGIYQASYKITEQLIAKGADINAFDYKGMTALMHASANGAEATTELLLAKGANASMKNKDGKSAYILAKNVQTKVLFTTETTAKDKMEALLLACENGSLKHVEKLFPSDPVAEKKVLAQCWKTLIYEYKKSGKLNFLECGKYFVNRNVPSIAGISFISPIIFYGVNHKTVFGPNVVRKDLSLSIFSELWYKILDLSGTGSLEESVKYSREFEFLWRSGVRGTAEDILMLVAIIAYFDQTANQYLQGPKYILPSRRKHYDELAAIFRKLYSMQEEELKDLMEKAKNRS